MLGGTRSLALLITLLVGLCTTTAFAQEPAEPAASDDMPEMSLIDAAILGVVEGLTEYLPVSSTGHLLVVQNLLDIGVADERSKRAADAYAICIQAGAIVAVLGLYFRRVKQGFAGIAGRDPAGRRLVINLLAGFLPAAIIGVSFNKMIKAYLFGPWPIVVAWFAGGLAILIVTYHRRRANMAPTTGRSLDELAWQAALLIGFAQCLAMWPGVSRSLITIVGGVVVGLSLPAAVEFSFLLGVITLGAATCYDALGSGSLMLEYYAPLTLALGLVMAFVSAVVAIKWMVAYLQTHSMAIFGWYRIAIAIVVAALIVAGVIVV